MSKNDFDAYLKAISTSPDRLTRQTVKTAGKLAEKLAGRAREGAPVQDGQLRESLKAYTTREGDVIEGGVHSTLPHAIYQEMGTGPVGDANPHPLENELHPARTAEGWTYQSAEVAAQRGEAYVKDEKGGYVYTEGVPARGYLYNAINSMEGEIDRELGACLSMEVILDE
ncbi:MAG: HK97 gp10 family phage protein [Clostridiales bacterium]|nr:HK97 gp10 family phage protein [Clostridiales bacterium]